MLKFPIWFVLFFKIGLAVQFDKSLHIVHEHSVPVEEDNFSTNLLHLMLNCWPFPNLFGLGPRPWVMDRDSINSAPIIQTGPRGN